MRHAVRTGREGELRLDDLAHDLRPPVEVRESDPTAPARRRAPLLEEALVGGKQLLAAALELLPLAPRRAIQAPGEQRQTNAFVRRTVGALLAQEPTGSSEVQARLFRTAHDELEIAQADLGLELLGHGDSGG